MAEKGKSLIEMMKESISRAGSSKRATFYLKKDGKCRVRFLNDMDDGIAVLFHDKFGEFNHPCLKYYGKKCPNCDNKEARSAENYIWTIYNYETKQRELFMYKANKASPIPMLIAMQEAYGTITDRDYIIQRLGEGTDTTYQVVPNDKAPFKVTGENATPYTKSEVLKKIYEAFPCDDAEDDDDEDSDDEAPWDDEDDGYEDMKPIDLYKICKEKGISAEPKKSKDYYINLLRK
jgi:hypothetical protein